jgi:hypothetical protein
MVFLSRDRNRLFLLQTSAMTTFLSLLLDQGSEMLTTGSKKKKKKIKERAWPGAEISQGEEQEGNAVRAGSFHPLIFQSVSKHAMLINRPDSCPCSWPVQFLCLPLILILPVSGAMCPLGNVHFRRLKDSGVQLSFAEDKQAYQRG